MLGLGHDNVLQGNQFIIPSDAFIASEFSVLFSFLLAVVSSPATCDVLGHDDILKNSDDCDFLILLDF